MTVPLWTDGKLGDDILSEVFSSNNDEYYTESESSAGSVTNRENADLCGPIGEKFIVCLREAEDQRSAGSNDHVLDEMVQHLTREEAKVVNDVLLRQPSIVAWDLDQLRPADMPYRHWLKLLDSSPICPPLRRLAESINNIVKKEIHMMMNTRIITPANSPWGFFCGNFLKKDGSPGFVLFTWR